jgi:hypothetical protein
MIVSYQTPCPCTARVNQSYGYMDSVGLSLVKAKCIGILPKGTLTIQVSWHLTMYHGHRLNNQHIYIRVLSLLSWLMASTRRPKPIPIMHLTNKQCETSLCPIKHSSQAVQSYTDDGQLANSNTSNHWIKLGRVHQTLLARLSSLGGNAKVIGTTLSVLAQQE